MQPRHLQLLSLVQIKQHDIYNYTSYRHRTYKSLSVAVKSVLQAQFIKFTSVSEEAQWLEKRRPVTKRLPAQSRGKMWAE